MTCRVGKRSVLLAEGHCQGRGELRSQKTRSPVTLRHASEPNKIGEGLLTLKFEIA